MMIDQSGQGHTWGRVWRFEIRTFERPPERLTQAAELFFLRHCRSIAATASGSQKLTGAVGQCCDERSEIHSLVTTLSSSLDLIFLAVAWVPVNGVTITLVTALVQGTPEETTVAMFTSVLVASGFHLNLRCCQCLSCWVTWHMTGDSWSGPGRAALCLGSILWPAFPRREAVDVEMTDNQPWFKRPREKGPGPSALRIRETGKTAPTPLAPESTPKGSPVQRPIWR